MINDHLQLVFLLKNQSALQSMWSLLNQDYACLILEQLQDPLVCASKKK
ncbi:hypothetical protein [Rheinheimera sp.]